MTILGLLAPPEYTRENIFIPSLGRLPFLQRISARPVTIFWPCPEVVIISDKHCIGMGSGHVPPRLGQQNASSRDRGVFDLERKKRNWPSAGIEGRYTFPVGHPEHEHCRIVVAPFKPWQWRRRGWDKCRGEGESRRKR